MGRWTPVWRAGQARTVTDPLSQYAQAAVLWERLLVGGIVVVDAQDPARRPDADAAMRSIRTQRFILQLPAPAPQSRQQQQQQEQADSNN